MDSFRTSFWSEIVMMCLTSHSRLNADDQGVKSARWPTVMA